MPARGRLFGRRFISILTILLGANLSWNAPDQPSPHFQNQQKMTVGLDDQRSDHRFFNRSRDVAMVTDFGGRIGKIGCHIPHSFSTLACLGRCVPQWHDASAQSNTHIPQPTPNGIWIHSSILPQYTFWADIQTNRSTDGLGDSR